MTSSRIVLSHGCFDPLHIGHLKHFKAAKAMGDMLVVAITRDKFVNKGARRPVFSEQLRKEMIEELRCVDLTVLVESTLHALESVKPHIFVKGGDYVTRIEPQHRQYCEAHGIEIRFTNEVHYSSTDLLHYYDRPIIPQ